MIDPACSALVLLLLAASPPAQASSEKDEARKLGHSAHGDAFDEGPRERPWKMEGIGSSHFPITTPVAEVQQWFDQGNTLLHSFWYYEAERAFRWCLKLDPDCAMAYWGLARAMGRNSARGRARDPMREAVRRKGSVSERERMYIEAWEAAFMPELSGAIELMDEDREGFRVLAEELEKIVLAYPDDVEAKALLGLCVYFQRYPGARSGNDLLLKEVLAEHPLHPGSHHYLIHNWDGAEGAAALDSCELYGRLARNVGHANHMPGHIYSGIGMWHEGAIWMDSATRVEKEYMQRRMIFPFNDWNYAHNRNYLAYIQEQLGMAERSLAGARELLAAPLDPKYNKADASDHGTFREGLHILARALVKFERWEEIVREDGVPWPDTDEWRRWRTYSEALAHLALGDRETAVERLIELKEMEKEPGEDPLLARQLAEARGLLALRDGDDLDGLRILGEAAQEQLERFHRENDPPSYPRILYNVIGESYLERGSPALAARAFERTLEVVVNDGFALSGLARAHAALGATAEAADALARLRFVWADADPGLRWRESALALGIEAQPRDQAPRTQRRYAAQALDELGPERWEPPRAPLLDALDSEGARVSLAEYSGRNVLLVFYLGARCVHCVEQLAAIDARIGDFERRDVDVLAISSDGPEKNAAALEIGRLPIRLLSDEDHANARRFKSYDDFEEMELHSTILIDREGRLRWARSGGDPFMDFDFVLAEIDRAGGLGAGGLAAGSTGEDGAGTR